MTCFNSGNRSRIIARSTFPRKPVQPSKSIVLLLKASIAEISPVPWRGGGSPDSYSPRTGFHLHVVRDFINEPWQWKGTEEASLTIRPIQGLASASQRQFAAAETSDSLLRHDRQ